MINSSKTNRFHFTKSEAKKSVSLTHGSAVLAVQSFVLTPARAVAAGMKWRPSRWLRCNHVKCLNNLILGVESEIGDCQLSNDGVWSASLSFPWDLVTKLVVGEAGEILYMAHHKQNKHVFTDARYISFTSNRRC